MVSNLHYNALNALGLTVWQPRAQPPDFAIIPHHIRINARCLVLLYGEQQQKILSGMLSVLTLPPKDIMQATIYGANPNLTEITTQIDQWQPEFILQLSMELPEIVRYNCVRTFSPGYLMHNPAYKAQAYKALLTLRAKLHVTT